MKSKMTKADLLAELQSAEKRMTKLESALKKAKGGDNDMDGGPAEAEKEALYRNFIEQSHDGIAMFDRTGSISMWNPAQERITGIPNAKAFGQKYWDIQYQLMVPKSRERLTPDIIKTALQNAFETGKHPNLGKATRVEIQAVDGKRKFIEMAPFSVKFAESYRIGTITRDITEQKHMEDSLQENEQRFSQVFHSNPSPQMIVEMENGHILNVNDALCQLSGYKREELLNRTTQELKLWVHPVEMRNMLMKLRSGGRVRELETEFRDKSGGILTLLVSFEPIILNGLECIIATGVNITERKQAEISLHKNQLILQETQEVARIQGWTADFKKNTFSVGPNDDLILGWKAGEHSFEDLRNLVHPADYEYVISAWRKIAKKGGVVDIEHRILVDGNLKWLHVKSHRTQDEGKPWLRRGFTQDITERKQAETLTNIQRDLAHASNTFTTNEEAWPHCMEATLKASGMDSGGIYLLNAVSGALELVYHQGLESKFTQAVSHFTKESQNVKMVVAGEMFYFTESELYLRDYNQEEGLRSLAVIPILDHGHVLGCMNIGSHFLPYVPELARTALETIAAEIGSIIAHLSTEARLRESEEKYRSLIESQGSSISTIDAEGVFHYINQIGAAWIAGTPEEVVGKRLQDFFHPRVAEQQLKSIRQVITSGQGLTTEYKNTFENVDRWWHVSIQPIRDADGQVSLVMVNSQDITERMKIQEELREARERLLEAQHLAHLGNWEWEPDKQSLIWSHEVYNIFGVSPTEISPTVEFLENAIHPQDKEDFLRQREKMLAEKQAASIDHRIILPDGQVRYVQERTQLILDENRAVTRVIGTVQDITDRKLTEKERHESEEKYRLVAENVSDVIWILDLESSVFRYVSPSVEQMRGFSMNEVMEQDMLEALTPESAEYLIKSLPDRITEFHHGSSKSYTDEIEQPRKDGSTVWTETTTRFVINPETGHLEVYGVSRDITDRKKSEEMIRMIENRNTALIEHAPDGIALLDKNGIFIFASPSAYLMFGYSKDEIIGTSSRKKMHPDDMPILDVLRDRLMNDPLEPQKIEYRFRHKDGAYRWLESTYTNMLNEPSIQGIVINFHDVTERKESETALRQSEASFRGIFEDATLGIYRTTPDGRILMSNPALVHMLGFEDFEELSQRNLEKDGSNTSYSRSEFRQRIEQEGAVIGLESTWRKKDGSPIHVRENAHVFFDENGNVQFYEGTVEDITERKRAEEELIRLNKENELILTSVGEGIIGVDEQGHHTFVNAAAARMLGYEEDELLGKPGHKIWHHKKPDESPYPENECEIVRSYREGIPHRSSIEVFWRKDGSSFPVEYVSTPMNNQGKLSGAVITFSDITARLKSEASLRESESRASAMLNAIPDLIFRLNSDGVFLDYKADIHDLYVQSEPTILGKRNRDLTPPEFAELIEEKIKETLDTGNVQTFEYQLPIINRGIRTYEARMAASGENEVVAVVHDITEHKQAENLLRQRVSELEMLYETGLSLSQLLSPVQIGRKLIEALEQKLDWHHIVIRLYDPSNDSMQVLAFSMGNTTAGDYFTDQTTSPIVGLSGWALQHSQVVRSGDISHDSRYHETFPGMNSGIYVPMKSRRNLIGVISIEKAERDAFTETDEHLIVTLANQAAVAIENARLNNDLEERVKQRTAEVQDMYENSPTGYHSLDASGKFLLINQTELNWLGRTHEEMIGHAIQEFLTPESIVKFRKNYPVFKQQGYLHDMEMDFVRKDGSILQLLVNATTILDKNGNFMMSRSTAIDNTEHKAAEEAMRRANTEMARAMRMKDEFLASMSHELRTPLTGILGLSEALQMDVYGTLSDKQRSTIKIVETSGRHLLELINDILDVSKIEAGKLELQMETCSLGEICQSSIQLTKGMAGTKHQNIDFNMRPANISLLGDARRLKQVIVNLLSNAVKFTPEEGSLGLDVVLDEDAKIVRMTVWDTGIGMHQEDIQKLFQPFVQLDSSLSRQHGGTGLGLVLVQRLVEMHGGSIEVQSKPGQGSRFNIILPCKPINRNNTALLKYKSALIIEDNPVDAEQLSRYARALGIIPFTQPDGGNALDFAITLQPDVIFLDIHLPDISGWDLLAEFKASKSTQHIPIVITSGEDEKKKATELNADGYLVKFYTIADVRTALEKIHHPSNDSERPALSQENTATVMIVDDNEVNISSLADYLTAQNFTVVSVKGGVEFLSRAPQVMPDIVLMDIQMPGMDGLETTRRLRLLPNRRLASVPVVAVTALAMPGDREHCINAGANEYISKPFHLLEVKELIQKLLAENKHMGNA